jgi:hypothetical protein
METINHLNQQLHDCQKQYSDLLTNKSNDTFHQLTRMTEDKEKLEHTCQELQVYICLSLYLSSFTLVKVFLSTTILYIVELGLLIR